MNHKMRILLIEDDPKISKLLSEYLEKYNYEVVLATQFDKILEVFTEQDPQLVLLDINLPRYDGFYWCRQIRTLSNCPIIFLSARDSGMDQVMAIENGGDDYITKPFSFEVVLAKVKGLLRRVYGEYASEKTTHYLDHSGLILHMDAMEIEWESVKIELTKKEFILIHAFMQRPNQVLSRTNLLELLWDDQTFVDDNTLSVNITRLRKKLEDLGLSNAIHTVRGMGYKFIPYWGETP